MSTATAKQIALYNALLAAIAATGEFDADVVAVAVEGFPEKTVADASVAIDRAKATAERLGVKPLWKAADAAQAPAAPVAGLDLTGLPAGTYAVPGGDTRLKVEIDKPEKGKWAGWVFVKDGAVYGQGQRYGSQRPGAAYKGQIEDALRAIVADPAGAMAAYGHLTGTCGICHAPLEREESIARGMGPVCARKFAW